MDRILIGNSMLIMMLMKFGDMFSLFHILKGFIGFEMAHLSGANEISPGMFSLQI